MFFFKKNYTLAIYVRTVSKFAQSWGVKPFQGLTKVMERNTNIYDIKYVYYENITNKESNDT